MSSAEITAFVLAGGRSSRMGTDKALLEFDGIPLIERALAAVRTLTSTVFLVGSQSRLCRFGPVVEDVFPERGPLGGIHAALRASRSEWNLILAVDVPFVSSEFLAFLARCAQESQAVVTAPRAAGHWQPLCAMYRKSFAEVASQALQAGQNRIDALFPLVAVRAIDDAELARLAFDPAMFENLNTPEDWQRARLRAGTS